MINICFNFFWSVIKNYHKAILSEDKLEILNEKKRLSNKHMIKTVSSWI